jgi:predicted phage terminase large subunit-like protein
MKVSKEKFQEILRSDFVMFVQRSFRELNPETVYLHNWHIEVIAEALEQCRMGKLRRLIINLPPRSLKSHMTSVSFVAWLLGHNPAAQVICASYAQDLADKLAMDCRSVVTSSWYQSLLTKMRLAARRPAVNDFATTERGFRMATSVGGVLTGRGADFIVIDDPLRPDEALSETRRKAVNEWFDHSLISRLNNKRDGCIILIMQRLHEGDLVGHVLQQGDWRVLKFPAIAQENEIHRIQTPYGSKVFCRKEGEALHAEREPLEVLAQMREIQGEYNFAGQYQQAPSPLGGGIIKTHWLRFYQQEELPETFEFVFQSWDTANKSSELSDYTVGTTWGMQKNHLYLLHVLRKRMDYPDLRRAVKKSAEEYRVRNILIEDRASGTQLIQDLIADGVHSVTRYQTQLDKVMRMHSVTSTFENGFVHLPAQAYWLPEFLHELAVFPNGKYDDQVDSTSQALDWFKNNSTQGEYGLLVYHKREQEKENTAQQAATVPDSMPCTNCNGVMNHRNPAGLQCRDCGAQWSPPRPAIRYPTRKDFLNGWKFNRFSTRLR